jgi:hypothetical protein
MVGQIEPALVQMLLLLLNPVPAGRQPPPPAAAAGAMHCDRNTPGQNLALHKLGTQQMQRGNQQKQQSWHLRQEGTLLQQP